MPDRHTKVKANTDSGAVEITVPVQAAREPPTDTQVGMTPGTSEHDFTVRDVPHEDDMTDSTAQPDRRKPQPQTVLNVQHPQTPGLPGWNGIIAQWGAFGFVLMLCYFMWSNIRETSKDDRTYARERDTLLREEIRLVRESGDRQGVAFIAAMNTLHTKFDTTNLHMNATATEFRAAKSQLEMKLDKIMEALKVKIEGLGLGALAPLKNGGP